MLWFAAAGTWVLFVQAQYLARRRRARQLAKQGQWHAIYLHAINEFDYLHSKGTDLGLFRTFGVPKISRLGMATKEFVNDPEARYDATDVLVREALVNAPDTERHKLACARLNQIHARYTSHIQNQQMLYAMACMITQPVDLINKYGARRLTTEEEDAIVWANVQYGVGLSMTNMPATLQEWRQYQVQHERQYLQYDPANKQLADAMLPYFVAKWPACIQDMVLKSFLAFVEPQLADAIGLTQDPRYHVSALHRALVHGALLLRKAFLRLLVPPSTAWCSRVVAGALPPQGQPLFCRYHQYAPPSLSAGYHLESIGTKKCPAVGREELLQKWSTARYAPDDAPPIAHNKCVLSMDQL